MNPSGLGALVYADGRDAIHDCGEASLRFSLEEKGSGQDPLARCYWMTVLLAGIVRGFCFMYTLNDSMAQILLWE